MRGLLKFIESSDQSFVELPLALSYIKAGFPSPAADYEWEGCDIKQYLVRHPIATFFMRVSGDSMDGLGIHDGDLLVIDRAENARDGSIVVARVRDEFCVKQLRIVKGRYWLCSANNAYNPIEIPTPYPDSLQTEFEVWGVVTHSITHLNRRKK